MKKKIIIIAVCAAVAAGGAFAGYKIISGRTPENLISPQIGSIEKIVSEDGVVTSEDTYNITSKVSGQITECYVAAGDKIKSGQVLYVLDSKSISDEIEQTEISLDKARVSYSTESKDLNAQIEEAEIVLSKAEETYNQSVNALNNLSVKSNASGTVSEIYVNTGDYVTAGAKVADITNASVLILKIPFQSADISSIYISEDCSVILSNGNEIPGTISKIYDTVTGFNGGKSGVYTEITVNNPGSLKAGDTASAVAGDMACLAEGVFENETEQTVLSTENGYIESIYINEGDTVSNDTPIAVIRNDSLSNAVVSAELDISEQQSTLSHLRQKLGESASALEIKELENKLSQLKSSLDDYKITAPQDGVIKTLTAKKNDYASPEQPLAVAAVTENAYVETDIDEMYINGIKPGQQVRITPQNEDEATYFGIVCEIKTEGKTENGITYYTVKTKLDDSSGLMDAMNVRTEIITESKDNVLLLPRDAVVENTVQVYENGKTVDSEISTGIKNDEYIEITGGITETSKIVSNSAQEG